MARHPGSLPAQSRRVPPRYSWPRSRQRCRRIRRPRSGTGLGSRGCPLRFARTPEQRWLVNAGYIFSTRPGALSSRRRTSSPQPDRMISRLSPAFCRTFLPTSVAGAPSRACHVTDTQVLNTDHVKTAGQIRGGLLDPVLASVRVAGLSFAMASFSWTRRFEPRPARASLRWRWRSLRCRPGLSRGAASISPVDSAALMATPRSTPTTLSLPGAGMDSGIAAKAMCHRPARSKVTR